MTKGKKMTLFVLQALENQLLNAEASEGRKDILKSIKKELEEVQTALSWVRKTKCQ